METIKFVDKAGRPRKGIAVNCKNCQSQFPTRRDQPAKYCCKKCSEVARRKRETFFCAQCNKKFERSPSKKKNSKSGLYFCTRECKEEAQRLGGIEIIMPPHYGTAKEDTTYRTLFENHEFVCSRCGYEEFSCSVEIHHIDENRANNDKENLIPLCACCHRSLHCKKWDISDITL